MVTPIDLERIDAADESSIIMRKLGFPFSMAFQPIVDLAQKEVFSYEALVRGIGGEPAGTVLNQVNAANQYSFDQACRMKAIHLASRLAVETFLNINLLPNAVYHPDANIRTTLAAARRIGFPTNRIVFEVTESEPIGDAVRLAAIMREHRRLGFLTAIDDFGAGYSGLNLLAELHPDFIKLDISLIHRIEVDVRRQIIVRGILSTCWDLKIEVIAEGVETEGEMHVLRDLGIRYFQGYLFATPAFESLPAVEWPNELGRSRHDLNIPSLSGCETRFGD